MQIKSLLLLSTLALPLITPHVAFSSEKSTEQKQDPTITKNIEMAKDYLMYASAFNVPEAPGSTYADYFLADLSASDSTVVEPYKNKVNDIEIWKKLILNNQYIIRDIEHRALIKSIIKKDKDLSRDEIQLLYAVQKFINHNIFNTENKLAEQRSDLSKNMLALTTFPELLSNEAKLKDLTPDNSVKLDKIIEFITANNEPKKYDIYVEVVKSDVTKDFSIKPEFQAELSKFSESEKLLLKTKPGLIIEISEMVRVSPNSEISHDGYLLYSFTLDESKLDIKNVYLIRLVPHDAQNINADKDSKIFSANSLSDKIQKITGQKRKSLRFISSSDKENLVVNRSYSRRDSRINEEIQQNNPGRIFTNYPKEQRAALEEAYNPESRHNQRYLPNSRSSRSDEVISGGKSSHFLPPITTSPNQYR